MSINQWKILNNLKDTISKFGNDRSIQNTFTRDFLQLIQKVPPSLYINNVIKYFESTRFLSTKNDSKDDAKGESYLPAVLHDLKSKIGVSKESSVKWKHNVRVSESDLSPKIEQILQFFDRSTSDESVLNSIEQLLTLIKKHPEIKNKAVQGGAIRRLLRIRSKVQNELIQGSLRESLALLGYADPVPKKGIRVLAIDGGGIRGLLVLEMLKKLEELTGKRVYELFDFICGVSTGAILAFSIGIHQRSLDEISNSYEKISNEVFKQSSWRGTGSLVWSQSYYDTALWEKKLKEHLGEQSLISTARDPKCPKICAISAIVNQARLSAHVFRNYSLPWKFQSQYLGSCDSELWQATRASAAAPTYFEEFKLGNLLHQDGGILVNNPTAVALHEVKLIWPYTPVQCVVSFGTGRTVPSPIEFAKQMENPDPISSSTSWASKFYKILDSATDTEAVHTVLNDLLPANIYYRFNPYLTEMVGMVETDPKKLEQLKRDAVMYLRRNEDKFQECAKVLMEKKSAVQAVKDYVKVQREMLGF